LSLDDEDDWKLKVYVAANENGGVSVIYPAPNYPGGKDDWIKRHDLDIAEESIELWPIQLPADRSTRHLWRIEDGSLVIGSDNKTP
jgi:hypothetical protein